MAPSCMCSRDGRHTNTYKNKTEPQLIVQNIKNKSLTIPQAPDFIHIFSHNY